MALSGETITVFVQGLDQVQRNLESFPAKLARKGMRASLRAGSDIIRRAAFLLAPKGPPLPGFLAEHIGSKLRIASDGLSGSAFVGPKGKIDYPDEGGGYRVRTFHNTGKTRKVGRISVASVARFLEFGTSKMGKKPFLTQAFESYKVSAMNRIIEKLKDAFNSCASELH